MPDETDGEATGDREGAATGLRERVDRREKSDAGARRMIRRGLARRLGIDPRGLAAVRIALGVALLADLLVLRLPGVRTFYSDRGLLPRETLAASYPTFESVSLHALSGSVEWQALLFGVTALALACFAIGYRTRLATAVALVLLTSMHARNPLAVNGGDTIALSLLAFGLFLPLGRRWSVDARRRVQRATPDETDARRVASVATGAFCLHFALIYLVNGLLKLQSDAWTSGRATARIFQLEEHTAGLGPIFAEAPQVLVATNWLWIALLLSAPLLVLLTGRRRLVVVAAFVLAQLGMAVSMRLGAFPFVMIAALLAFAPPVMWNRVEATARERGVDRRLGGAIGRGRSRAPSESCVSRIGSIRRLGDRLPARSRTVGRSLATTVVVGMLVVSVLWQVPMLDGVNSPVEADLDDGSWAFFAPNPPSDTRWFVVEASLEGGETVDLRDGGDVELDRPPDAAQPYPGTLWLRYGSDLRWGPDHQYEAAVAYLCERSDRDVDSVRIHLVEQPVGPDGPAGDPTATERYAGTC